MNKLLSQRCQPMKCTRFITTHNKVADPDLELYTQYGVPFKNKSAKKDSRWKGFRSKFRGGPSPRLPLYCNAMHFTQLHVTLYYPIILSCFKCKSFFYIFIFPLLYLTFIVNTFSLLDCIRRNHGMVCGHGLSATSL